MAGLSGVVNFGQCVWSTGWSCRTEVYIPTLVNVKRVVTDTGNPDTKNKVCVSFWKRNESLVFSYNDNAYSIGLEEIQVYFDLENPARKTIEIVQCKDADGFNLLHADILVDIMRMGIRNKSWLLTQVIRLEGP